MGLFQNNPNLIKGAQNFASGVAKTIKNTNISSAIMTASSIYFNTKEKKIWYFSPATNLQSGAEIIDKDNNTISLDSAVSAAQNAPSALVTDGGIITMRSEDASNALANSSVLPEAYFIDMQLDYGGQVVNSPIEEGSYNTYNKTTQPLSIEATLAFDENKGRGIVKQNNVMRLSDTIDRLILLKKSPILFNIITPYYEYQNMTLESFSYGYVLDQGLGVLIVKAHFKEVPQIAVLTIEPQDVKDTTCADTKQMGSKAPKKQSLAFQVEKGGGFLNKVKEMIPFPFGG